MANLQCPQSQIQSSLDSQTFEQILQQQQFIPQPYPQDFNNPDISNDNYDIEYIIEQKLIKKNDKTQRKIFLLWAKYAAQMKRDRNLFFSIKNFIIKRLTSKAYRSMKLHYVQNKLVDHYRQRYVRNLMYQAYVNWHHVISVDKQFKTIMTKFAQNLNKMYQNTLYLDGFETLNEFYNAKKVRLRLKMRVVKYWARKMKVKIFNVIRNNVHDKSEDRELGLKCLLFEQKRLQKSGFQIIKSNVLFSKFWRKMKIRSLRVFSRRYKSIAIEGFKKILQIRQNRINNEGVIRQYQTKWQNNLLREIIQAMRLQNNHNKTSGQILIQVLERSISQRNGFCQLQRYSNNVEEITTHMKLKRFINILKQNVELKKEKQNFKLQCIENYKTNLKRFALSNMKEGLFNQKQQSNLLGYCLEKLDTKLSLITNFQKIKQYAFRQYVLQTLLNKKHNSLLLRSFKQFLINQKLQIFSDALIQKISLAQRFHFWKEFALEDKRLIRLQARAVKHRNRFLKRKYFYLFKRKICPKLFVLPKHRSNLLSKSIQAFRMNRIKQRVLSFKVKKVQNIHIMRVKSKFMNIWYQQAMSNIKLCQMEIQMNKQASDHRRHFILSRCISGMKQLTYQRRVFNYLRHKDFQLKCQQFMQKLKDGYISQRAKILMQNKGNQIMYFKLAQKYFNILRRNTQITKIKNFQTHQARQHYGSILAKKSLISFYRNTQLSQQKRKLISQALEDKQQSQMRQTLTKLLEVGIYWATIKQRFGINQRNNRVYLGLKYGMRWRAKTLIIKFLRTQPQNIQRNNKQRALNQVENTVTQQVRAKLMSQQQQKFATISRPPLPLQLSQQQQQMQTINATQRSHQSYNSIISNQNRLKEIESEILAFKNKKLLLKELEEQFRQMQGNPQLQDLMKQKYNTLRNELIQIQPKIKLLLEEISKIKSQQQIMNQTQTINQTFLSNNEPSFMLSKSVISNYN